MDGKLKSTKVYLLVGFQVICFAFLWAGKIDQSTLLAMSMPTFVAWLGAHVAQRRAQIANGNK